VYMYILLTDDDDDDNTYNYNTRLYYIMYYTIIPVSDEAINRLYNMRVGARKTSAIRPADFLV